MTDPGSAGSSEVDRAHAPYGKACLNCVRSKTRCANSGSGSKCERCVRLKKDCQPAPTVRKKRAPKRPISSLGSVANKTAALEERLDGIVQLLQSTQTSQSQTTTPLSGQTVNQLHDTTHHEDLSLSTFDNRNLPSSDACNLLRAAQNDANYSPAHESQIPATSHGSTATNAPSYSGPANKSSSSRSNEYPPEREDECQDYLETYRSKMVAFLPIVVIGPDVTVKELREKRPFLWLVIRAICNKNMARQKALGLEVRRILGEQMLFEGAKTMDLFLGVLVFVGWGHYYVHTNPIMTLALHLGMSLAADLGLTKPPPSEPFVMLHYNTQGCPKPRHNLPTQRTMEQRRAVIGLFLLSSIAANFFQRHEPMRWTPYMDECLRLLDDLKEVATDQLLVHVVRVQLIRNRVATVTKADAFQVGDSGFRLPQDLFMQAVQSQLEESKRSIPSELQSNAILQSYILDATASIHEHSLNVSPSKDLTFDPASQIRRMEDLWACFTATKSWFTTFFSLNKFPISSFPHISMAVFTHLAHFTVTLFRLSTFESPHVPWDRQRVVRECNYGETIRTWIERMEAVPNAVGLDTNLLTEEDETVWSYTAKSLSVLLNFWEAKIAPKLANNPETHGKREDATENSVEAPDQQHVEAVDFGAMNLDFFDDVWIKDMLEGSYDSFREMYF